MRQFALHRFLVTAGLELLALLALSSGAASHHMVPVMARTYEPQQETIYIDNNDMRTCFNPLLPCPQPFETWFEGDRMYGTIERTSGGYRDSTLDAIGVDPDGIVPALPFGARWNLIQGFPAGNYRVEVNIPSVSYRGAAIVSVAFYVIRRGNLEETVGVSQRTERGWVDLGTYYFEPGLMGAVARNSVSIDVQSSYNTDINSTLIDAVRFVPIVEPPQPVTVDAYLVGVPEGGHVSAGTRVRHCYSISRAAPIRWSWFKEGAGWSQIKDDPAGQGECTDSDPLQGAGQRQTRIQALSDGSVVAEDQTTFYVDEASVPPTTIPSAVPTSPPPPSVTPTPVRSIQVWIESGCGRTYAVGQPIRVGVQADSPGIARLSFQPQGIEFAVRSLRAGSPELIDTNVEGPPGAQAVEARLEVRNLTVATATCEYRVSAATSTATVTAPRPTARPTERYAAYLPLAIRALEIRPTPFLPDPPATGTESSSTKTPSPTPTPKPSATVASAPRSLSLVGQIGGESNAVASSGAFVYVGRGPRLLIIDATDGRLPRLVGQSVPLPGPVNSIAIVATHAYVATTRGGLQIIDVSDPAAPSLVGALKLGDDALDVAVVGDYAYVIAWGFTSDFFAVDVSIPTRPRLVGHVDTPDLAYSVAVEGQYAFVADWFNGLQIIDVSNPRAPRLRGSLRSQTADDVAVDGDNAYLIGGIEGLQVIDVSNRDAPRLVAGLRTRGWANSVVASSGHVYLTGADIGFVTVDVSRSDSPQVASTVDAEGAHAAAIAGNSAYVVTGHYSSGKLMEVIDVSDRMHPQTLGAVPATGMIEDLAVDGRYGYAADRIGLQLYDLSVPDMPRPTSRINLPAVSALAISSGFAYAVSNGNGLHVIDIRNPQSPRPVTTIGLIQDQVSDLAISGSLVVALTLDRLQVIDVHDPGSPRPLGWLPFPGNPSGIAIQGNFAYVTLGDNGLQIIDLSDPSVPQRIGTVSIEDAVDVMVAGRYAYVVTYANEKSGLQIIDVVDPRNPRAVSDILAWNSCGSVTRSGDLAYVGCGINDFEGKQSVVYVIDLSDIARPTIVERVSVPSGARHIVVDGLYLYIAGGDGGIEILRGE